MKTAYAFVYRLYRVMGALFVIALILTVLGGITLREIFGVPLVWANEVGITLFVWTVFIGAGISLAENAHIRFTIVVDRLPLTLRRAVGLLVTYTGLVLLVGLWLTSVYLAYLYRDQRFTTIAVSAVWDWAALPAGLFLAILGWVRYGKWTWSSPELSERSLIDMPL